jgi:hypothetical protein
VTLALDDTQALRFVNELVAFGYSVEHGGEKTICTGPEIKFILIKATASNRGISELRISLPRQKRGQRTYRFGKRSVLKFKGMKAVWGF